MLAFIYGLTNYCLKYLIIIIFFLRETFSEIVSEKKSKHGG